MGPRSGGLTQVDAWRLLAAQSIADGWYYDSSDTEIYR